jgi:DNA-binding beta-propeller fold protein YncE
MLCVRRSLLRSARSGWILALAGGAVLTLSSLGLLPGYGDDAQALTPAEATAGSSTVNHYEYAFLSGEMYVWDMDNGQELVQHATGLPDTDGVRGVMVNPTTNTLYISHGGDGPGTEEPGHEFDGSLLAYDLVTEKVLWNVSYPFPIDSGAISPDGTKIYMPTGENDASGVWNVLSASNGELIGSIQTGAPGAHNTIVSLDGKYVYLGSRDRNYLDVASTATDKVVREIGPLVEGVRPFTVNGTNTLAYTTETEFLGFQVSSIVTGKVLYTVEFPGLVSPYPFEFSAPSHGITLTPNEKQLYVFDAVHETIHVFDVSDVPTGPPVPVAEIKLSSIGVGSQQSPCDYDCLKSGWLQASLNGRFVYVGDSGDVIDTETLKVLKTLPALAQTREMLEIDWADGAPIATSTRYGLGYVTSSSEPPKEEPPKEEPSKIEGPGETPNEEPHHEPAPDEARNEQQDPLSSGLPASSLSISSTPALTPPALVSSTSNEPSAATAKIEDLRIDPAVFRVGGRGVRISYRDSLPARAALMVLRAAVGVEDGHRCVKRSHGLGESGRRCGLYVSVASFTHDDEATVNSFGFSGGIDASRFSPGVYQLRVTPWFDGRFGVRKVVGFRVVD